MAKQPRSIDTLPESEQVEFYTMLNDWYELSEQAAVLKAKENEARRALVAKFFPDAKEGVNTLSIAYGKVLKANVPVTRTVDDPQLEALKKLATSEGRVSVLSLCDTLFTYKPSLAVGEWKDLSDDERKLFADVITEKPGMPSLSIETPKK